jgi:hypothetical protein
MAKPIAAPLLMYAQRICLSFGVWKANVSVLATEGIAGPGVAPLLAFALMSSSLTKNPSGMGYEEIPSSSLRTSTVCSQNGAKSPASVILSILSPSTARSMRRGAEFPGALP